MSSGAGPRLLRTRHVSERACASVQPSLTPFGLNPQENPHPSAANFQEFHQEDTALQIVEVIQVRRQLETPRAP